MIPIRAALESTSELGPLFATIDKVVLPTRNRWPEMTFSAVGGFELS